MACKGGLHLINRHMLLSGFVSELLTGKSQALRFGFDSSLDFLGISLMLVADQIFLVSMLLMS